MLVCVHLRYVSAGACMSYHTQRGQWITFGSQELIIFFQCGFVGQALLPTPTKGVILTCLSWHSYLKTFKFGFIKTAEGEHISTT